MMMKSESSTSLQSSASKITEIVRLQQILKKWKKLAINGRRRTGDADPATTAATAGATKSSNINKLLKKTLSFSENMNVPPKGYVAVLVGKELKRFVIPMSYLGHHSFAHLLREAEEEFGFQQEGLLKFPCQVPVFQNTLKMMQATATTTTDNDVSIPAYCEYSTPPDCERRHHHHPGPPQMCR